MGLGQTKFLRELLKSANCCGTTEIICPCSKKELGQLIDFVIHGKFQCEDEIDSSKVFDNLIKILGFPSNLGSPGKFTLDDQGDTSANDINFPSNTNNEN